MRGEHNADDLNRLSSQPGGPGYLRALRALTKSEADPIPLLRRARVDLRHTPTWLVLALEEAELLREERRDEEARTLYWAIWRRTAPGTELTPSRHTRTRFRAFVGLVALARTDEDVPPLEAQAEHAVALARTRSWSQLQGLIEIWRARGWTTSLPSKRPLSWLGRPRRRRKGERFVTQEINGVAGEAVDRALLAELDRTYPLLSHCYHGGVPCLREQARALLATGGDAPPWLGLLDDGEAAWFRLLFGVRHKRWEVVKAEAETLLSSAQPRWAPHNHDLSDYSLGCGAAFWARRAAEALEEESDTQRAYLRGACAFGYYDLLDRGLSGERVKPNTYPDFAESTDSFASWHLASERGHPFGLEILRDDLLFRTPTPFDHHWVAEHASAGHAVALQWEFPLGELRDSATRTEQESFEEALPWLSAFRSAGKASNTHWVWLLAIARQESRFDPRVCSGSNACGMLQLKPAAAEFVAAKYKVPYQRPRDLEDPETNIALGSTLLTHLRMRLECGNLKALTAYNAGCP